MYCPSAARPRYDKHHGQQIEHDPGTEAGLKTQMQEALKHPRRGAEYRLLAALDKAVPPQFFAP